MLFVIGYTSSGKTTVARRLAQYVQVPFYDLDAEVEKEIKMSIAAFFQSAGEDAFRVIESKVLKYLVSTLPKNTIIACGGGTPCFHNNMAFLKSNGLTLYIETPIKTIHSYLKQNTPEKRPTVALNNLLIRKNLEAHFKNREPFYLDAHVKAPLKVAKSPELLTKTLILFTNTNPNLNYLPFFF